MKYALPWFTMFPKVTVSRGNPKPINPRNTSEPMEYGMVKAVSIIIKLIKWGIIFLLTIRIKGVPKHLEAMLYSLSLRDNILFRINFASLIHPLDAKAITMVAKLGFMMYVKSTRYTVDGTLVIML